MNIVSGSGVQRPTPGVCQVPDIAALMANFVPTNVGGHPYSSQIESTSRRPGRARRLDLSVVAHAHTDAPGGLRHSHPNVRDGACRGTLTGSELRRIRISGGVRD